MNRCTFCGSQLHGTSLECSCCAGRFDTFACLEHHGSMVHPMESRMPAKPVDVKRPYLSVALLCLMFAAIVLILLLDSGDFIG